MADARGVFAGAPVIKAKTGGFIKNMPVPHLQPMRFAAGGAVPSASGETVNLNLNLPTSGEPIKTTVQKADLPELFRQMDAINRRAAS